MPSPLQQAGALQEPSAYAALHTNRIFTGEWSNRNLLRDAATPFLYEKFYSASRQDSIVTGNNVEITSKLTLGRRPGHSVYNDQSFPAIDRFYEFREFSTSTEQIRVIADTAGTIFDATGPHTKTPIMTKAIGAGRACFQSVGNTLYIGDGVEEKEWVQSTLTWNPFTTYNAGQQIVDANGNIQVAFGFTSAIVTGSGLTAGPHPIGHPSVFDRLDLTLQGGVSPFANGTPLTFESLVLASQFNGQSYPVTNLGAGALRFFLDYVPPFFAGGADSGIVFGGGAGSGGTGISGAALPAFSATPEGVTFDGSVIWICKGSALRDWGLIAPTTAPTISQVPVVNPFGTWAASTYYSPNNVTYNAANPTDFALLSQDGVTGGGEPIFNPAFGGNTNDGTAKWSTINTVWVAAAPYLPGTILVASVGGQLTAFVCILAGNAGATTPNWAGPFGVQITDGAAVWQNIGPVVEWTAIGAGANVTQKQTILDSGGFEQNITTAGVSGVAAPAWNENPTQLTTDNSAAWTNGGAFAAAATQAAFYAFSYSDSVTGEESTVSPRTTAFSVLANHRPLVQGPSDPQQWGDTVNIYRTDQGGSTLFYSGSVPSMAPGGIWSYLDLVPDANLAIQIQAATAEANSPPPAGLTAMVYHLNCIFGAVNNTIYYSASPGSGPGVNTSNFPPLNNFVVPSTVVRMWSTSIGLLVFTVSDVYLIGGQNTAQSPLYITLFLNGLGLLSYDAFAVTGTTIFLMTTTNSVISLDPSSGVVDVGFPVSDQFATQFNPALAYLTWHTGSSNDSALYVADGSTKWKRLSSITAPESGQAWSPTATIVGGMQAVKSIEVTPGQKKLLLGPKPAADVVLLITDITIAGGTGTVSHSNLFLPAPNMPFTFAGLTTVPGLNGTTVYVTTATNGAFTFETGQPPIVLSAETGTATGPGAWVNSGPILFRDPTTNADNGAAYPANVVFGNIVLAQPGQVAGLQFITLESPQIGTRPGVNILLGEVSGKFEKLTRTRQDPPILPPSKTLFNDRYTVGQAARAAWCHHFQLQIDWGTQNVPNELLTFTVFGQLRSEFKEAP